MNDSTKKRFWWKLEFTGRSSGNSKLAAPPVRPYCWRETPTWKLIRRFTRTVIGHANLCAGIAPHWQSICWKANFWTWERTFTWAVSDAWSFWGCERARFFWMKPVKLMPYASQTTPFLKRVGLSAWEFKTDWCQCSFGLRNESKFIWNGKERGIWDICSIDWMWWRSNYRLRERVEDSWRCYSTTRSNSVRKRGWDGWNRMHQNFKGLPMAQNIRELHPVKILWF